MPTIISHALVPLAFGAGLGPRRVSTALVAAGMVAAILPDADVVAFRMGIPYGDAFGHRGASHSLFAAVLIGVLGAAGSRWLSVTPVKAFLFILLAAASHGLLDTLTNGGHGVALLWPWSDQRYFAPVRPIEVSPIGLTGLLSSRGASVLASELLWIGMPCLLFASAMRSRLFRSTREAIPDDG